jgi:hypothetical protein
VLVLPHKSQIKAGSAYLKMKYVCHLPTVNGHRARTHLEACKTEIIDERQRKANNKKGHLTSGMGKKLKKTKRFRPRGQKIRKT